MNKQVFEITEEGLKKVEAELVELKEVERPANIVALQEARAQGDLSENADYDAARNDQARIENRILELENILKNSKVITVSKQNKVVSIGTIVTLLDKRTNKNVEFHIVGSFESNPLNNKISLECPLGKAIDKASVKDVRTVRPERSAEYEVEIISIENK